MTGHLEQPLPEEEHHARIGRRPKLPVNRQAQRIAVGSQWPPNQADAAGGWGMLSAWTLETGMPGTTTKTLS